MFFFHRIIHQQNQDQDGSQGREADRGQEGGDAAGEEDISNESSGQSFFSSGSQLRRLAPVSLVLGLSLGLM